jgi:hypothetical protein
VADTVKAEYDKKDIRQILKSFKAMDDEAVAQSKKMGFDLAQYLVGEIRNAARTPQELRIGATGRASKSSKIGEFSFGYARREFSGGASSARNRERQSPYGDGILAGVEFGSNRLSNFRRRKMGSREKGYFIFPTLTRNQKELINRWERSFAEIIKRFK